MEKSQGKEGDRLTHGSLFSGIGGFELGAALAGIDTLWSCEIAAFQRAVLGLRFPDTEIHGNITETGGLPRVDIISGGFPCQDISVAGAGVGIKGSRSGLWGEMFSIVGEVRPRYVIIENSPALVIRGFERVLCDLSQIGYDAEWQCIPNSSFGFPHRRERIYVVAYPHEIRQQACGQHDGGFAPLLKPWSPVDDGHYALAGRVLALGDCIDYRGNDGVPGWAHRIGALGNAVNPCVARYLFECVKHFDRRLRGSGD